MSHKFQPLSDAEWPADIADMKDGFAGGLNVYRVMAHHPALLRAWAGLRDHIVNESVLKPDQREIVILRTGHRLNAAYEWAHHVSRARALGMDEARIMSIAGPASAMEPTDAVLVKAVDALMDNARLDCPARDALEQLSGPQGVLDVIATVGFYTTLAFIVKSFDVPVDASITTPFDPAQ
jgi:alkylhydroperoxidase family enzyme